MRELIDKQPIVQVPDEELHRLLGLPPGRALDDHWQGLQTELGEWYREQGHPWMYALRLDGMKVQRDSIRVAGVEFKSARLARRFREVAAGSVYVAAVSAGIECESRANQAWLEGRSDEYFFLEMFGAAVVEQLIRILGSRLCQANSPIGRAVLPHYSPGFTGWDILDQIKLWALLNAQASLPGSIEIMETGMIHPKKSLLALFGVTERMDLARRISSGLPCQRCSLERCQYLRIPLEVEEPG